MIYGFGATSVTYGSITGLVGEAITPLTPTVARTGIATFTATSLPAGLTIDPATGIISGTPTGATLPGTTFHVTMTDLAGSDTETVSIAIAKASPAIATAASSATVGQTISDVATITGLVNPIAGSTVDFRLYAASDSDCANPVGSVLAVATTPQGAGVLTASASLATTLAGTYRWVATFSGDANNTTIAGGCGAAGETSAVAKATPTITGTPSAGVMVGEQITDSATVAARVLPRPGATIEFRLYGPGDTSCLARRRSHRSACRTR